MSSSKPVRQLAQQTGLSYGTTHTIVRRKLHYHPYKVSVVQELLPPDVFNNMKRRVDTCLNNNGTHFEQQL
ncbi:hypothetical protein QE152_g19648 [Popillia japonica]|uniref:Uncharacterized protein n=1 Tax=Popillia japonica TaxID=7064 RepID=A0AAW1KN56_POPJA